MKLTRGLLALALTFSLTFVAFITLPVRTANAQEKSVALQRGYRTGYSDGYMAGYRDSIDAAAKNVTTHSEYYEARRAYNKDYGTIEDYRDGYQQGFESGYDTGFDKKSFESSVPTGIARRGIKESGQIASASDTPIETASAPASAATVPDIPVTNDVQPAAATSPETTTAATPDTSTGTSETAPPSGSVQTVSYQGETAPVIIIPRDTEIIVELNEDLSTNRSREGDKFTAKVVSPAELSGATVEGRISKIQQPVRLKRRSEMLLAFDRIVLTETRWSNFSAILTEVLPVKGDNVKRIDGEGTAVGKGSFKEDGIKVGAATGTGAGIGALTGGPVGAAVGAGVGAAFGVGAVVIERGKHIHLNPNQQLRIRSTFDAKIR